MSGTTRDRVEAIEGWWHSVDVGDGVVTPGQKSAPLLAEELSGLRLPALDGKRVLDIGAWDGFFSFSCEEAGAAEVVALDHWVWSIDLPALERRRQQAIREGVPMPNPESLPDIWRPDELPGKVGFDLARELRGSRVQSIVADFMEADLEPLGTFDVVLYLGVLYHIENPMAAIRRLASVTREMAIIETEAMLIPACPNASLASFFPFDELNADVSNWWVPTFEALEGFCLAAGFSKVEALTPKPTHSNKVSWRPSKREKQKARLGKPIHYRLVVQATK